MVTTQLLNGAGFNVKKIKTKPKFILFDDNCRNPPSSNLVATCLIIHCNWSKSKFSVIQSKISKL